jgi:hypothetical protein
MTSGQCRAGVVCALMPLALLVAPGSTGSAGAAPIAGPPGGDTFVAMYGEPGDFISQAQQVLYRQPAPADQNQSNVIGSSSNETDSTRLQVGFPDDGEISLNAPTGHQLTLGRHHVFPEATDTQWTMALSFEGRACNSTDGWIDIRDLRVDPSSGLQRLSMTFTQYCDGSSSALSGEVEFGEPASPALEATPAHLDFPDRAVGTTSPDEPVTFVNTSGAPQTITDTALSGSAEFVKGQDGCRGRSLPAGASCAVVVRFAPSSAATGSGSLTVTAASGARATTSLDGQGIATVTGMFVTDTLPNGLVVPLGSFRWDRGGSFQENFEDRGAFVRAATMQDHPGNEWEGELQAPDGKSFSAGETFRTSVQADATHAENTISGTEQPACEVLSSTMHVIQWDVDPDYDDPAHIEFTFTDVCANGVGTIRGVVADHATDGSRRPAPQLALPHRPFSVSDILKPRWSGPSSDLSGYQIRVATATAGTPIGAWQISPETAEGHAHLPTIRGTTTCLSVRAISLLQEPSVWSRRQCTATLVNASLLLPSPAGGPNQGWSAAHNKHAIGHVLAHATRRGSTLGLERVDGDRFAVRAMVGRKFGSIDVYVDNRLLRHIDLARHRHRSRLVTFLSSRRKPISGELRIVVTSHHRPVDVDALGVRPA